MKNLFLFCVCAMVLGIDASAQPAQPRYHFDNFDTATGVVVEIPQALHVPANRLRATTAGAPAAGKSKLKPTAYAAARTDAATPVSMATRQSLDGFTTGNSKVDGIIADAGARHGVDPVLLYAVMHRESAFKQRAISHKGARGLMQLMPATAARFGVRDIFDPAQNIEGGARYMRFLLNFFDGNVALALAGYNAGEGAVLRYGRRIPPYRETQEYVRRITERYSLMRNPQTARTAPKITRQQVAAINATETQDVTIYERNVFAVRLPDGKLRLVSQ
ncbi:MAG: lytic transglycosylase domain-containing protein [Pyrinomonadaceae bacterium]